MARIRFSTTTTTPTIGVPRRRWHKPIYNHNLFVKCSPAFVFRAQLLHVSGDAGKQLGVGATGKGAHAIAAGGGGGGGAAPDEVAAAGGLEGERSSGGDLHVAPERVAGGGEASSAADRAPAGRVAELEECVAHAEKEVGERDEMIGFMSRRIEDEGLGGREHYGKKSREWFQKEVEEEELVGSTRRLEEEVEKNHRTLGAAAAGEEPCRVGADGDGGCRCEGCISGCLLYTSTNPCNSPITKPNHTARKESVDSIAPHEHALCSLL
ncbi:hypothetical protein DEO72_LG2g2904 [Vigna unguiculata]|uniref:Uncharacterized protein n=1 Tax=Vigna unguiculata TaxID=3917 RepID=A0A4D6L287_VIGUN|nr:hypothetical protein DEO72_LG2g2904 [Vigna unguiculata]